MSVERSVIRAELTQLASRGVGIRWWVYERQDLLKLNAVVATAGSDPTDDALADALIATLAEASARVPSRQYQRLLPVVLGIDPEYRELSTTDRRAVAGRVFRGGKSSVTWGTIRQHHEPKALEQLAEVLHADEVNASGGTATP